MQSLILACAVKALLIAVGMAAVLRVLRVKAPRAQHAVWAAAVLWMLALPAWSAWGPKAIVHVLRPAAAPTATRAETFTEPSSAPPPVLPLSPSAWTWEQCLTGIYFAGFLALFARLAIGTVRAHLLLRRSTQCECAGHGPAPLLLTSASCAAPLTAGWLNPIVILPEEWRQWPQAQLRAVLAHEGEHARWRDPLVQWLALLNRAIFWFHPVAWWIERRLSVLSEEACDAAVLQRGYDPREYSEYLLAIARAMQQSGSRLNVAGMAMPGPFLPQRIRRIMEGPPAQRLSRVRTVCMAMACAMVSTVIAAAAMDYAPISKPQIAPGLIALPVAEESVAVAPPQRQKVLLAQAQANPARPAETSQPAASISGTVLDPSGSRVPGCTVVLHSPSGDEVATTRSNPVGIYQFSSIPPGHYTVEYRMPGFANLKRDVAVGAVQPAHLDAQLRIGETNSTIQVVGRKLSTAAAESPSDPNRISVGGRVEVSKILRHPDPIYPPELREQGIEGTVRLNAIISSDGVPVDLRVLNTGEVDARLIQAALDAVSQWRYQPMKLNEHPVASTTNIDVRFELEK